MSELILHHYPESLFSEKARAMLNAKGLAWRSTLIPMIMPRPDTIPLTGGYRRTPVLQIGADIYCDTAAIAAVIDPLGSGPTLFAATSRLASQTLARWIDTELFWAAVTLRFQPQNTGSFFASAEAAAAFAQDRANFSQGATVRRMPLEEAEPRYRLFLDELEAQLSDGRAHLFGADWSIADFSAYHVIWFIHQGRAMGEWLAARPAATAWYARMARHSTPIGRELSGPDALAVAKASEPAAVADASSDIAGAPLGTLVDVAPTDYGVMPSRGELVRADSCWLSIRRSHERTGTVHVHFPRHGFGATPV